MIVGDLVVQHYLANRSVRLKFQNKDHAFVMKRVLCVCLYRFISLFVTNFSSLSFHNTTFYKTVPGLQRFVPTFDPLPDVGAAPGETAHIDLEIYGFPEQRALTLLKVFDSTGLTSSPRHSVKYTAREAPLGFVNETISDVIDIDHTNYTLTVDNGEGEALTYLFYLYEGKLASRFV